MSEDKVILIVEDQPLFVGAAEQAEKNYYKGRVHDVQKFSDADSAVDWMKDRLRMSDGEEYGYVVIGFPEGNFSDVTNRNGDPVIKSKGTITPKKKSHTQGED